MNTPDKDKLNASMRLLGLHRGEARGAYDAVAGDYDGFANLWDRHIAVPALEFYNLLIRQHVRPGALVLDAGAGNGERTLALYDLPRNALLECHGRVDTTCDGLLALPLP